MLAAVLSTACMEGDKTTPGDTSMPGQSPVSAPSPDDTGSVSVHYGDSPNSDHQLLKQSLESWQAFNEAAADIDSAFVIPRSLQIVFSDCGEANAAYDPAQTAIFMCYELVNDLIADYRNFAMSDSALSTAVWQTTFFIFYHELGHALIDILDLPVTGREEDAVDQLATIILLESGSEGRDAALLGAGWFQRASLRAGADIPFWDEHSLNSQRYFNIVCWVYGSDPDSHAGLLGPDWGLPPERAQRCVAEYDRMNRAWMSVLERHQEPEAEN